MPVIYNFANTFDFTTIIPSHIKMYLFACFFLNSKYKNMTDDKDPIRNLIN